jgi:hypothetical protein
MRDNVDDPWDAEFIDKIGDEDHEKLYELLLAANYMDIPSLLDLGCAKFVTLMTNQPLETVRKILMVGQNKRDQQSSKTAKKDDLQDSKEDSKVDDGKKDEQDKD